MDGDIETGTEARWIVSKYGWLSISRWPEPVWDGIGTSRERLDLMKEGATGGLEET